MTDHLTCIVCNKQFTRLGKHGPVPKYCSNACRQKQQRQRPERIEYERTHKARARALGKRKQYEYNYNRRPDVRERNRNRYMMRWHSDPMFRHRELVRMRRTLYPEIVIPAPYTGHRWLDMARAAAGNRNIDQGAPWADEYNDDVGEALLALLEGRDMKQAVREYRNKEYPYRRLMVHLGDFQDDEGQDRFFDRLMPTVQSAEDDYIDSIEPIRYYEATKFSDVSNKSRKMKHKTSQPSNRKSNRR